MKELDKPVLIKEKVEVFAQKEIEKQLKLIGHIRPHKGQTVFEINCSTAEIKKAEFKTVDVHFNLAAKKDFSPHKKIVANENCIYIVALNKANALKKFFKILPHAINKIK